VDWPIVGEDFNNKNVKLFFINKNEILSVDNCISTGERLDRFGYFFLKKYVMVQSKIFIKIKFEKVVQEIRKFESALPIFSHWLYNLTDYNILLLLLLLQPRL